ncbi:MAG: ribosome-associated translation inhibitor RaiA [Xanthomonadales bacterium]|nr:ribosome-associated translation inhibitor RaiA [Xanthomonadales bacterium]
MNIVLTGRQIDVTEPLKAYVHSKFERLARHFDEVIDTQVTLEVDKLEHRADANLHVRGRHLHAHAEGVDMYAAIDLLADKLDRQLLKHKEQRHDHHRAQNPKAANF